MIINVIADYMNAIDKNITEFSDLVGISRNSISNLIKKNDELSSYKIDTLQKICSSLDIPVGYLIKYVDETICIKSISLEKTNRISIDFANSQGKTVSIIGKLIPFAKEVKDATGHPIELPHLSLEIDLEKYYAKIPLSQTEKQINIEVLSDSIAYRRLFIEEIVVSGIKVYFDEFFKGYSKFRDIYTVNFHLTMVGMMKAHYSYQFLISFENDNWRIERQLPVPVEIEEVDDFI